MVPTLDVRYRPTGKRELMQNPQQVLRRPPCQRDKRRSCSPSCSWAPAAVPVLLGHSCIHACILVCSFEYPQLAPSCPLRQSTGMWTSCEHCPAFYLGKLRQPHAAAQAQRDHSDSRCVLELLTQLLLMPLPAFGGPPLPALARAAAVLAAAAAAAPLTAPHHGVAPLHTSTQAVAAATC
jgi:hypothetical protein